MLRHSKNNQQGAIQSLLLIAVMAVLLPIIFSVTSYRHSLKGPTDIYKGDFYLQQNTIRYSHERSWSLANFNLALEQVVTDWRFCNKTNLPALLDQVSNRLAEDLPGDTEELLLSTEEGIVLELAGKPNKLTFLPRETPGMPTYNPDSFRTELQFFKTANPIVHADSSYERLLVPIQIKAGRMHKGNPTTYHWPELRFMFLEVDTSAATPRVAACFHERSPRKICFEQGKKFSEDTWPHCA